jgi:hypothetical protein
LQAGNRASDDLIYVTTHSNKAGQQRFGFWDKDINFVQSYGQSLFCLLLRLLLQHFIQKHE